jgi:hypothetical protein
MKPKRATAARGIDRQPHGADARPLGVLEEAAMPMDEAELVSVRQANALHALNYERQLAAKIVAMIRNTGTDPRRVLAIVDAILNLPIAE